MIFISRIKYIAGSSLDTLYTTHVYLTGPNEGSPGYASSHYASTRLLHRHLMNRRWQDCSSSIFKENPCKYNQCCHTPYSVPALRTHWSLAAVKRGMAFNVGAGTIIRLTKMNNWYVCGSTHGATCFLIIIVDFYEARLVVLGKISERFIIFRTNEKHSNAIGTARQ